MNNESVKIGDIFHSSWGYSMTINSYYQVVGKKGKTSVVLREIKSEKEGYFDGKETPIKDSFKKDDTFTKRVKDYGYGVAAVKINDCEYAKIWSGKANLFNNND